MKSFTLPLTTASELPRALASHLIGQDRRDWHNLEAIGQCEHCGGKLVEKMIVMPELDSVEYDYICKNSNCPSKDY